MRKGLGRCLPQMTLIPVNIFSWSVSACMDLNNTGHALSMIELDCEKKKPSLAIWLNICKYNYSEHYSVRLRLWSYEQVNVKYLLPNGTLLFWVHPGTNGAVECFREFRIIWQWTNNSGNERLDSLLLTLTACRCSCTFLCLDVKFNGGSAREPCRIWSNVSMTLYYKL